MGGFVETRGGEEHPLDLSEVEKLTPEAHPALLAPISGFKSMSPSDDPFAKASGTSSLNQEESPLIALHTGPSSTDNILRQTSSGSRSQHESTRSAAPRYRVLVTENAILDKSKTNALAKLVTVAQTTWFVVQLIERWANHQPRTQLEVMTVAYAALNAVLYILLWHKPYNVNEPINVSGRAHDRDHIRTIGLWSSRSLFKDAFFAMQVGKTPNGENMGSLMFVLVGGIFGGLHCLAWWFHFPTEREAVLWRVCAVYCTVVPVVILLAFMPANYWGDLNVPDLVKTAASSGMLLGIVLYIICRLILLALTLSSLQKLPAGVFETTPWTKFIPHIS